MKETVLGYLRRKANWWFIRQGSPSETFITVLHHKTTSVFLLVFSFRLRPVRHILCVCQDKNSTAWSIKKPFILYTSEKDAWHTYTQFIRKYLFHICKKNLAIERNAVCYFMESFQRPLTLCYHGYQCIKSSLIETVHVMMIDEMEGRFGSENQKKN